MDAASWTHWAPFTTQPMTATPVADTVNTALNDGEACWAPPLQPALLESI